MSLEQTPIDPDEWLSVSDVAAKLDMHPSTVRQWARDGVLPAVRIGRRQWRIRRAALQALEGQNAPGSPDSASISSRESGSLDPLALNSDEDLVETGDV